MSKTLYLKYRPQKFEELIGQDHIKITLENEIQTDKVSHAYLFLGPRGIGKTTLARIFAKSLNCKNRVGYEPCNECDSCKSIVGGNNMDLVEIDAASNRGINEIRELREMVKYPPSNGKYKVFIIDEAHMLTIEAFNALLKTLEEPPKHAIFILATTEFHKLPLTIVSRCQKFEFKVVDLDKLKRHMKYVCDGENIKISDEVLEQIVRYSGGYVRDALSTLGQILSLAEGNEVNMDTASLILPQSNFELIVDIVDNIIFEKFDFAIRNLDRLIANGVDLEYFAEELINYLRKVLLVKLSGASQDYLWDIDKNIESKIMEQSEKLDLKVWHGILNEFYDSFEHLKNDRFKQLPLEMAIVSIKTKYFDKKNNDNNGSNYFSGSSSSGSGTSGVKNTIIKKDLVEDAPKISVTEMPSVNSSPIEKIKPSKVEESDFIKTEEVRSTSAKINSSLDDIIRAWPQLLLNLKDFNHSLSAFIKVGHPLRIEGNRVTIGFEYKFHLDRILDAKNKKAIEDVLSGILNENIAVGAQLDEDYEENHRKMTVVEKREEEEVESDGNSNIVEDLMQSFGGEMV